MQARRRARDEAAAGAALTHAVVGWLPRARLRRLQLSVLRIQAAARRGGALEALGVRQVRAEFARRRERIMHDLMALDVSARQTAARRGLPMDDKQAAAHAKRVAMLRYQLNQIDKLRRAALKDAMARAAEAAAAVRACATAEARAAAAARGTQRPLPEEVRWDAAKAARRARDASKVADKAAEKALSAVQPAAEAARARPGLPSRGRGERGGGEGGGGERGGQHSRRPKRRSWRRRRPVKKRRRRSKRLKLAELQAAEAAVAHEADEGAQAAVEGRERAKEAALAALATGGLDAVSEGTLAEAMAALEGELAAGPSDAKRFALRKQMLALGAAHKKAKKTRVEYETAQEEIAARRRIAHAQYIGPANASSRYAETNRPKSPLTRRGLRGFPMRGAPPEAVAQQLPVAAATEEEEEEPPSAAELHHRAHHRRHVAAHAAASTRHFLASGRWP